MNGNKRRHGVAFPEQMPEVMRCDFCTRECSMGDLIGRNYNHHKFGAAEVSWICGPCNLHILLDVGPRDQNGNLMRFAKYE